MQKLPPIPRRNFFKAAFLASAALGAAPGALRLQAAVVKNRRASFAPLKVGLTSYSLRKFDLDQAIAMTRELGVKYISLKDVHLPLDSSPEQCRAAREKIERAGLILMGGGVIYMKDNPAEIQRDFEYAKNAGMPTIICSPDPGALDAVEAAAKHYDVRVAIHNHGPGDKRYPSPFDVFRMVKDRDARMGLCMDVGHTVRIGVDPIQAIDNCAGRLYDFHLKDETKAAPNGRPTELGKGVIDIVGVIQALVRIHYAHDVELEYEAHADNPMPGMQQCYAYLRGVLDTLAA